MSRKKGLSLEEKREKMIEIFYEKKEFFQLKELEKIAPKEKGIVAQSVKDVVQSLVDDNLVDSEKIGTSIYFWAFPSKAANTRKRKLENLESELKEIAKKKTTATDKLKKARIGRENTKEREHILKELDVVNSEFKNLNAKLKEYQNCDPEVMKEMNQQIKIFKGAANRWTDNIYCIKSWCKNKFGIEENTLNKHFGIPEELDYID